MVKKKDTECFDTADTLITDAVIADEKAARKLEAAIPEKTKAKAEHKKEIYVYLGPTVKGVITNGRIFSGTKEEIIRTVAESAEAVGLKKKMTKIARLIVADTDISNVKQQLKAGDNGISLAYNAILADEEEKQ